jgi:inner membrane protein
MRPFYHSAPEHPLSELFISSIRWQIFSLYCPFCFACSLHERSGKWNGKFNNFCAFVTKNRSKLYPALLIVLVVWLAVLPVQNYFL